MAVNTITLCAGIDTLPSPEKIQVLFEAPESEIGKTFELVRLYRQSISDTKKVADYDSKNPGLVVFDLPETATVAKYDKQTLLLRFDSRQHANAFMDAICRPVPGYSNEVAIKKYPNLQELEIELRGAHVREVDPAPNRNQQPAQAAEVPIQNNNDNANNNDNVNRKKKKKKKKINNDNNNDNDKKKNNKNNNNNNNNNKRRSSSARRTS